MISTTSYDTTEEYISLKMDICGLMVKTPLGYLSYDQAIQVGLQSAHTDIKMCNWCMGVCMGVPTH